MFRRQFLSAMGLGVGTGLLAPSGMLRATTQPNITDSFVKAGDWQALRKLFPLTHKYIQLSTFLLASHPKPVSDAIDKHRKAFDENPSYYGH
jgi:hypothetical protein